MTNDIPFIPIIPDGLREAAQFGTLIPFIGAGASALAGCPRWNEFADGALKHFAEIGKLSFSELEQLKGRSPRVKLSLAKALENEHKSRIDFRKLLHPNGCVSSEGIKLYGSLSQLAKIFVTTNYDEWLDEEFPSSIFQPSPSSSPKVPGPAGRKRKVIYKVDEMIPSCLNQPGTVIHLHGSLLDPTNMVLTTRDYIKHYANDRYLSGIAEKENRVLTFLTQLFKEKTVLFVGYGLDELEILEYVIMKAGQLLGSKSSETKHYILQGYFSHERDIVRSMRLYYRDECGIELIPFSKDVKDHKQLFDVLDNFAKVAPASDPMFLKEFDEMKGLLDG